MGYSKVIRVSFFYYSLFAFALILISCSHQKQKYFSLLPSTRTNIKFVNKIKDTPQLNIFNYYDFYNGGGVAIGDINNDGLPDIFFTGNETKNKLYLNKGDFRFKDITDSAGVSGTMGSWSTGVTMADVNGDNYLDIYVCQVNYRNKSGANELFINNKDGTFTEKAAKYGLNFKGYSSQAVFFDYNNDGKLDMYLLNQSFPRKSIFGNADTLRNKIDPKAGDKLFKNEGNYFKDATMEAGIYSSALGLGLGVAVSDINQDGWLDLYVGNDLHEDDYLYINNGDGTFSESLSSSIGHTSRSSMGNDIADFNNDGKVDIISVDMMAKDRETYMSSGGPQFYPLYKKYIKLGYAPANARNTLQLNRGKSPNGTQLFSEIAFGSKVARTTWSWAPLFMDMDNDGLKDLYITNGMVHRTNNLDAARKRDIKTAKLANNSDFETQKELVSVLQLMPQEKVSNYAFKNNGDLTFSNKAKQWGLSYPSISSGTAYADLDKDGDLDLVVNNTNMPPFIFKNNLEKKDSTARYLRVRLIGDKSNTYAIGSKVILYNNKQKFYKEQILTRGFQSSVENVLHFGTKKNKTIDSLLVIWPDQSFQKLYNIETDQTLKLDQTDALGNFDYNKLSKNWNNALLTDVSDEISLSYSHKENKFNDFRRQPLMPYKLSTQGPAFCVGDINEDGLDDFFVGGAKGQPGKIFIQQRNGGFKSSNKEIFSNNRNSEDVDAIFFDATGNGKLDLYVVSGGSEISGNKSEFKDRLYINMGQGHLKKAKNSLPNIFGNGSTVTSADFDEDGDLDLFVGERSIPGMYGISPRSYLLENQGHGIFKDVTDELAPGLKRIGMVTDAKWIKISNNKYPDLIVAGEWMPIQIFVNDGSSLTPKTKKYGLADYSGLWQTILIDDVNSDGYQDIIAGNFGNNSRLQPSLKAPYKLYVNDFNDNGQIIPVIAKYIDGKYYPYEQLPELLFKLKFLINRVTSYEDYASKTMIELFGQESIKSSRTKEISELSSLVFINKGDSTFTSKKLPFEEQLSPLMAITTLDKYDQLLTAGNIYDVKQSMGGQQDASYGLDLKVNVNGSSIKTLGLQTSGFYIKGEARQIRKIKVGNKKMIIVAINNSKIKFFRY